MSVRSVVDLIFVISTISTIVSSCNIGIDEEDLKFVSACNLQNLMLHEESVYTASNDIEFRKTEEYVRIWKRAEYEIHATNTNKCFLNPFDLYSRRNEKFTPDPDCLKEKIKQWKVPGNLENAKNHSQVYSSTLEPTEVDTEYLYNLMVKSSSVQISPRYPTASEARDEQLINVKRLCSNPPTVSYDSELRCRYNFQNDPFLRIAPLKEEIVYSDPKITIFRDALYNSEMKKLMEEGKSRMFPNEKMENRTGEIRSEKQRRGVAFFRDDDFAEVSTITRRIRDLSGRHENFVQPWQITFYEVGGYFPVHSDLDHVNEEEVEEQGRRMATVSFILNNAKIGGATIFPSINLRIAPEEGDAVMWYNVREDGTEDIRVRHAVCPVMLGNRWEFIKRINEKRMRTRCI